MQNNKNDMTKRPTDYKCNICGEWHQINTICPIMNNKINKYRQQKKKNFLYGNIFLECMEKILISLT